MTTFNQILDDYAKRGLLDGNLVARLSAAYEREVATITADRDQWRKQALEEDARANEATTEKSSLVGNTAKMREALKRARPWLNATMEEITDEVKPVLDMVDAALAEPPRNCDVGTYDEQARRFYAFCQFHRSMIEGMCDCDCPCLGEKDMCRCLTKWMQMPYKEGDKNGN